MLISNEEIFILNYYLLNNLLPIFIKQSLKLQKVNQFCMLDEKDEVRTIKVVTNKLKQMVSTCICIMSRS